MKNQVKETSGLHGYGLITQAAVEAMVQAQAEVDAVLGGATPAFEDSRNSRMYSMCSSGSHCSRMRWQTVSIVRLESSNVRIAVRIFPCAVVLNPERFKATVLKARGRAQWPSAIVKGGMSLFAKAPAVRKL